ncbi:MAG TPA: ATP-binding protein [Candidatus Deferrimicrobiaceae bacterium]
MSGVPAAGRNGREPKGRNLILVRSVITFALLASVVSVQLRAPELLLTREFQLLYYTVLLSYGWLLLRYAAWGSSELPLYAAGLQALADVAFISLVVIATGLYDSVFSFMYVIVILLGSLERYFRGAVAWATLSAVAYTLLMYLQMKGYISPPGEDPAAIGFAQFARSALTHSAGFLMTGILSGILGEDIRKGRQRVQDRDDVIRTLESFHRNVIDNIPSGIITTGGRGEVSLINDTACGILGVAREEVSGRQIREVLAGFEVPSERMGGDGSRLPRPEILFRRPDGEEIHLGFSSSRMKDAKGRTTGHVVIFQDLTPIKQMEERVRIADRLAGVGELAAGLAHEIRNPLASIAGSSQLLRESSGVPGEDSAALLEIIERESRRLNGLITDFLAYAGPTARNVQTVNLPGLIRDVTEATRAGEARDRGVSISFPAMKELSVEGDPEQLRQVVWNLVRNALQATPPGGRILVDSFEQIRQGSRYVVATVTDSGAGISPQDLSKIFNPFFTTKEGGTGLGLSISQRIVHYHKGFIEVRSVPGKGSTFSVFLPATPEGEGEVPGNG